MASLKCATAVAKNALSEDNLYQIRVAGTDVILEQHLTATMVLAYFEQFDKIASRLLAGRAEAVLEIIPHTTSGERSR